MYEHPVQAAKLCLEQFPQESKIDTIRIVKDSLIVEEKIDSIYTWLVEEHYSEPEIKTKIRTIIKELKEPKLSEGITSLIKSGHNVIDQLAWEKINASEVISGEIAGKPRVKEVDWKRLISLGRS